jgi:hypothetical protein
MISLKKKSMMRSFFAFALLAIVLISCDVRNKDKQAIGSVVEKPLPAEATTVEIIDSVYDFGERKEGEIVEFNFRFKNTGPNPLVVTNVAASCGCTVPEKPEQPIRPGETGFIKAKFNTDKRPGEAMKTVTVTSNANPSFPELILKGKVLPKNEN